MCFLDTMTTLRSRFSEVTCPFFVQQGTDDTVCDPTGAQMFYDNASSVHKQFKVICTLFYCDQFHNVRCSFTRCRSDRFATSHKLTKPFVLRSTYHQGRIKGGGKGTRAPKAQVFLTNIILHRRALFYKFTDVTVMFLSRLALLGLYYFAT